MGVLLAVLGILVFIVFLAFLMGAFWPGYQTARPIPPQVKGPTQRFMERM
jgi:hypothetical protein